MKECGWAVVQMFMRVWTNSESEKGEECEYCGARAYEEVGGNRAPAKATVASEYDWQINTMRSFKDRVIQLSSGQYPDTSHQTVASRHRRLPVQIRSLPYSMCLRVTARVAGLIAVDR